VWVRLDVFSVFFSCLLQSVQVRPIYRCLFAALGSIREVHHLTHRILASEMEQVPFVGAVYGKMARSDACKYF